MFDRTQRLACIALVLISISGLAQASPAPANRVGLLEDASADFALRLKLIQNATHSLDLIMSQHAADAEIGLPLLLALRDAAKRGVKVRLLSGYFSSVFSHSTQALKMILNDDSLPTRPEVILDGEWFSSAIPSKDATMWTAFDEKIMIADGERAVLGGRNVGGDYLHWQDNSLYLEGPVVPQIQTSVFEPIWQMASRFYGKSSHDISTKRPWQHEAYGKFGVTPALAKGMAEAASIEAAPQYAPDEIEVLPNGLIANMLKRAHQHLPQPTPDPILEKFLALAKHSKRAYFYSLYPAADRRLAAGLAEAVHNGSKVALITNSIESSKTLSSDTLPYEGGITSMLALAHAGVTVYQWVPTPELSFMHQKMAVVDDYVIFGSHNFNYSSSHGYDHLDVVIHDPALADLLAQRFEQQAAQHTRVASADFLRRQRRSHIIGVEVSKLLLGLY